MSDKINATSIQKKKKIQLAPAERLKWNLKRSWCAYNKMWVEFGQLACGRKGILGVKNN